MKITLLTLVTLALATCGNGQAQNNNTATPGSEFTEATVAQEPQSDKAGGTVKRGDKTATVSKCYWGNYRKAIEIREDPYRKVYADFNFAAEFETGTYTITTEDGNTYNIPAWNINPRMPVVEGRDAD